jgi:hypothetical protein
MKQKTQYYILNDSVYFRVKNKEGIVYLGKKVILINEIGTLILNGILKGKNKEEIINKILKIYDIDKHNSSKDFDEFIGKLEQSGIIKKIKNRTKSKAKVPNGV